MSIDPDEDTGDWWLDALERTAAELKRPLYFNQRTNDELRRMLWGPNRRQAPPAIPGDCYEASFGMVHVKPGCRCPR